MYSFSPVAGKTSPQRPSPLSVPNQSTITTTVTTMNNTVSASSCSPSANSPPALTSSPTPSSSTKPKTQRISLELSKGGLPPLPSYLVRHKAGMSVYSGVDQDPQFNLNDEILDCRWAPDGKKIAINSATDGVVVYSHPVWRDPSADRNTEADKLQLELFHNSPQFFPRTLRHLQWSPKGTYLVAFWQYDIKASQNGQDERNVFVWDTSPAFTTRHQLNNPLKLTTAFTLKVISFGSSVAVYRNIGTQPIVRVPIAGIVQTEPAPVSPNSTAPDDSIAIATFSPAPTDGNSIFRIIEFVRSSAPDDAAAAFLWTVPVERPLGTADSAEITWNCDGTVVLVLASAVTDRAGGNYGSVGDAYLAKRDGSLTVKVNEKEAQDICWSPSTDKFVLIEGKSPSDIYIYDQNCRVQTKLPSAYRNTIRWDSAGQMLAIGGFGNLAGDISFWFQGQSDDVSCGPDPLHIAEWREPCVVSCDWSPDCEYFFTSSTFPRMRVDNQYCIFNRRGDLVLQKGLDPLFDFQWMPRRKARRCMDRPTPQPNISVPTTTNKFRVLGKEGVEKSDDEKRKILRKKEGGGSNSNVVTGGGLLVTTTKPAAVIAKDERARKLDSISDWRSGTRLGPLPKAEAVAPSRRSSASKGNIKQTSAAGASVDVSSTTVATTGHSPAADSMTNLALTSPPVTSVEGKAVKGTNIGGASKIGGLTAPDSITQPPQASLPIAEKSFSSDSAAGNSTTGPAATQAATIPVVSSNGSQIHHATIGILTNNQPAIMFPDERPTPTATSTTDDNMTASSGMVKSSDSFLVGVQHSATTTSQQGFDPLLSSSDGLLGLLKKILPPESNVRVFQQQQQPTSASPAPSDSIMGLLESIIACARQNPLPVSNSSDVPMYSSKGLLPTQQSLLTTPQQTGQYASLQPFQRVARPEVFQRDVNPLIVDPQPRLGGNSGGFSCGETLAQLLREKTQQHGVGRRLEVKTPLELQQQQSSRATTPASYPKTGKSFGPSFIPQTRQQTATLSGSYRQRKDNQTHQQLQNFNGRPDAMRDSCWEYLDLAGEVRGPFRAIEMRNWYCNGFLKPSLPIRCCSTDSFIALRHMYSSNDAFLHDPAT